MNTNGQQTQQEKQLDQAVNRALDTLLYDHNMVRVGTVRAPDGTVPFQESGAAPLAVKNNSPWYAAAWDRRQQLPGPVITSITYPSQSYTPWPGARNMPRYSGIEPFVPPQKNRSAYPYKTVKMSPAETGGFINRMWPGRSIQTIVPTREEILAYNGNLPLPRRIGTRMIDLPIGPNALTLEGLGSLGAVDWKGQLTHAAMPVLTGEQAPQAAFEQFAQQASQAYAEREGFVPAVTPAVTTPVVPQMTETQKRWERWKVPVAIGAAAMLAYTLLGGGKVKRNTHEGGYAPQGPGFVWGHKMAKGEA